MNKLADFPECSTGIDKCYFSIENSIKSLYEYWLGSYVYDVLELDRLALSGNRKCGQIY